MAIKQSLFLLGVATTLLGASGQCTSVSLGVYNYSDPTFSSWAYNGSSCGTGQRQSPVDLPQSSTLAGGKSSAAAATYGTVTGLTSSNNGNGPKIAPTASGASLGSIQITFAPNVGPVTYQAIQYHTHVKSEHTLAGQLYDAELHIVHSLDTTVTPPAGANPSTLAVVGVWLTASASAANNTCLNKVLNQIQAPGCSAPLDSIDMSCFAPQLTGGFWSYNGSLTSPPCSEVVTWFMTATPMVISSAQLQVLKASTTNGVNNRPTQPLNGRTVYWTPAVAQSKQASGGFHASPAALGVVLAMLLSPLAWK